MISIVPTMCIKIAGACSPSQVVIYRFSAKNQCTGDSLIVQNSSASYSLFKYMSLYRGPIYPIQMCKYSWMVSLPCCRFQEEIGRHPRRPIYCRPRLSIWDPWVVMLQHMLDRASEGITHLTRILVIREYQNKFKNCKISNGRKIWYRIQPGMYTPSDQSHFLVDSLKILELDKCKKILDMPKRTEYWSAVRTRQTKGSICLSSVGSTYIYVISVRTSNSISTLLTSIWQRRSQRYTPWPCSIVCN